MCENTFHQRSKFGVQTHRFQIMYMDWTTFFIQMCQLVASKSEDTSTKNGAVIIGSSNQVLSVGYNGLPRGMKPTPDRFERPAKYSYFEHSERNAIYNAARSGIQIENASIYITGFPCADCARAIIQSGIKKAIICDNIAFKDFHERWKDSIDSALEMLKECGVEVETVKWGGTQVGKAA
jgi:dCMP deaminase